MPMLDMPLQELQTYLGTNPCQEDLDVFWDTAVAEMEQTDPQVELVPAGFQVRNAACYDMWFAGVGGARVYAKLLKPKHIAGKAPAVVRSFYSAVSFWIPLSWRT